MGHRATGQQLLRISEAAEQLAVKESTIRAWLLARRISKVRVGRRAIRVPASEVERLISHGMVPARPAKSRLRQPSQRYGISDTRGRLVGLCCLCWFFWSCSRVLPQIGGNVHQESFVLLYLLATSLNSWTRRP